MKYRRFLWALTCVNVLGVTPVMAALITGVTTGAPVAGLALGTLRAA